MEVDIHQYYDSRAPGAVEVLGCDQWNGSVAQLTNFKNSTGATYPLLRTCSDLALATSYGISYDNFLVVDQNGIIRYISPYQNPLGQRYDLSAIRSAIDGLLPASVTDGPVAGRSDRSLAAAPNPVRDRVSFMLPRADRAAGEIVIASARGSVVRVIEAAVQAEPIVWDRRDGLGRVVGAGVYVATWVGANPSGPRRTARLVVLP